MRPLVAIVLLGVALSGCAGGGTDTNGRQVVTASTTPPSLADLVEKARTGVIRIETSSCDGEGVGSGFLLGPRLIATVEHVVEGASEIVLKRGGNAVAKAVVIGADRERDLALLRADKPIRGHRFKLATRTPRLGEEVAALGFPLGLPLTVTRGSVSGLQRAIPIDGVTRRRLVQTDAAVNQGNSGGPLLDIETGEVIGLVDLGTTEANGIAFAVSTEVASPLLAAWRASPQPLNLAASCYEDESGVVPEAEEPPPTEEPGPGLASFDGEYFAIAYPGDWYVETAEESKGSYLDTTIRDSDDESIMLRVDVIPETGADPAVNARRVRSGVSRLDGYEELDFSRAALGPYNAIRWEFLVEENGVLMHKVDVFFATDSGNEIAVLTQAPESEFASWAEIFEVMRSSLTAYR